MAKNKEAQPWERQDGEGEAAFQAFTEYRDMQKPRSASAVGKKLGKSATIMERWSSKHSWVKRAAAWDDEQDRVLRQQQLEEIKKMRKRHADLANAMLIKAAKALQNIPADEITAKDISGMVKTASELERISRGDAGEVVEMRDGGKAAQVVTMYMPDNGRDQTTGDGQEGEDE